MSHLGGEAAAIVPMPELRRHSAVGPNGSGKSNIVDAVAWVLGAQGPRALRSSKMEDVIFAGTSKRAGLGRALMRRRWPSCSVAPCEDRVVLRPAANSRFWTDKRRHPGAVT